MHCKGICSSYAVKKPHIKDIGRYESGQKRCSACEIYIIWNGKNCPCCGYILRTKPRNAKARDKLVQHINVKKSSK